MGRPRREPKSRTSTAVRFAPELHERLIAAAAERDVSANWIVNRAVAAYLDRLVPTEQLVVSEVER